MVIALAGFIVAALVFILSLCKAGAMEAPKFEANKEARQWE